jgi:anti-sigma-K factor RskA
MKLATHPALDALAAEYVLGTLRGAARRRFERALSSEPLVAGRVNYWQQRINLKPSAVQAVQPSREVWKRIERDLNLRALQPPWYSRLNIWRNWALAASVALVLVIGTQLIRVAEPPVELTAIATLAGDDVAVRGTTVSALLSRDGKRLALRSERAIVADAARSYELWLLPNGGGAPISLAVLGSLDAAFSVPPAQVGRIARGAKLAVSVEPAGGSKTGAPTGPVILVGAIS